MARDNFNPSVETEARLLLLIERFSRGANSLEGRTKLAKLDFFVRYPEFLDRILKLKGINDKGVPPDKSIDFESRMIRYRYGPWDPSYFATLGRLLGKRLIAAIPSNRGIAYRASDAGRSLADALRAESAWAEYVDRIDVVHRHLNLSGSNLKNLVYESFPEISQASWGKRL
ncbi:MAG: hypothetical protein U1F54_20460 [Burkholderiales bacterium]